LKLYQSLVNITANKTIMYSTKRITPTILFITKDLMHDRIMKVSSMIIDPIIIKTVSLVLLLLISKGMPFFPNSVSFYKHNILSVIPSPSMRLNIGPATQKVSAISPLPFLDIDALAMVSLIPLPQANTVSPKIVGDNPVSIPKSYNKSTIAFVVKYNQTIDIRNAAIWNKQNTAVGGALCKCVLK